MILTEVLNLLHEYSLNDDIKCVVMGTSCATCDCQSELYRQPVKHQTSCQTSGEEPGGVQLLMMVTSPLLLSALFLAADACLRPPAAPVTTTTTSLAPRCSFYGPSSTVPTNVNQLRPGDIGIIGSMGDSDSAAFGARASTLFTITQEDRDISFASGTSDDWEGQTSLANMLGQYNPDLVGGSSGTNNLLFSQDYQASQGLNYAVSGAWANTAPDQADQLMAAIKQEADWESKWKLITVQFGANDICVVSCETDPNSEDYGDATPSGWRSNMDSVLSKLSTMPRTLVVFTETYMPSKLQDMANPSWKCSLAIELGCPCVTSENMADKIQLRDDYTAELHSLAAQYRSSDFGVEIVPALTGLYPNATTGGPDASFLAPDCYHFNPDLHSMVIALTF